MTEPLLTDVEIAPDDSDLESPKTDPIAEGESFQMTNALWKTLFGAAAAVVAFLLVQQDLPLDPIVRVSLGCVAVALAVINPNRETA